MPNLSKFNNFLSAKSDANRLAGDSADSGSDGKKGNLVSDL
jgi:hypothetical protein